MTSQHPEPTVADPTNTDYHHRHHATEGGQPAASTSSTSELARLKIGLHRSLRQFPDFPTPGILFEDIMPIFASPALHESLIHALELHVRQAVAEQEMEKVDVVVGLEARGFLFGPSLALKLGAAFVPVRKKGKLPGPTVQATYMKEYGEDVFQMQSDAIMEGQKCLIVDDIIATGGSAVAAGNLVAMLRGTLIGYVFILELDYLKGREKLNAPVYTLLTSKDEALSKPP